MACPAWEKSVKCDERNHFASKCKSEAIYIMKYIEEEPTDLYDDALITTLQVNTVQSDVLFARIKVDAKKIRF